MAIKTSNKYEYDISNEHVYIPAHKKRNVNDLENTVTYNTWETVKIDELNDYDFMKWKAKIHVYFFKNNVKESNMFINGEKLCEINEKEQTKKYENGDVMPMDVTLHGQVVCKRRDQTEQKKYEQYIKYYNDVYENNIQHIDRVFINCWIMLNVCDRILWRLERSAYKDSWKSNGRIGREHKHSYIKDLNETRKCTKSIILSELCESKHKDWIKKIILGIKNNILSNFLFYEQENGLHEFVIQKNDNNDEYYVSNGEFVGISITKKYYATSCVRIHFSVNKGSIFHYYPDHDINSITEKCNNLGYDPRIMRDELSMENIKFLNDIYTNIKCKNSKNMCNKNKIFIKDSPKTILTQFLINKLGVESNGFLPSIEGKS